MKLSLTVLLIALASPAGAHGDAGWIMREGFRGPDGSSCCGPNDCGPLIDGDVKWTPTGWLIRSLGETVPESEALPSNDEHFWRCERRDGSRRCFFKPSPGT